MTLTHCSTRESCSGGMASIASSSVDSKTMREKTFMPLSSLEIHCQEIKHMGCQRRNSAEIQWTGDFRLVLVELDPATCLETFHELVAAGRMSFQMSATVQPQKSLERPKAILFDLFHTLVCVPPPSLTGDKSVPEILGVSPEE